LGLRRCLVPRAPAGARPRPSLGNLGAPSRAPLPGGDAAAAPRFLPTWDATLLVHARRTQILPERFRSRVFDVKTPHSLPTFLVDGAVAGAWRVETSARKATLVLEPFERLRRADRAQLRDEAEGLVRLVEPGATSYAGRGEA